MYRDLLLQLAGLAIITHVLQLRHNGLYTINKHVTPLPLPTYTHTHTELSLSIFHSLVFLWNKSRLLCLHYLTFNHSKLFYQNKLFSAQNLYLHFFIFLLVSLQPLQPLPQPLYLCCAASLHPPLSSLNISIWLCQLHFHPHFIYPLHLRPSPVLIIYAKVMAGAASPLSNQNFMRHCGGCQVLLEVYSILVLYGRHVEHRRYCIRVADRKQYPVWIFHNLL